MLDSGVHFLRVIAVQMAAQPTEEAPPEAVSAVEPDSTVGSLVEALRELRAPKSSEEWEQLVLLLLVRVGLPILGVLVVLIVSLFVAKSLRRAAEGALVRAKVELTLAKFMARVASWLFLALVVLTILSTVGVNITSLAALVGAAGLAVGLAVQGALTNLSAGVMLLIFRPYRIGDVVRLDGELGTVHDIELFTTKIDTPDNRRIILPNSRIYGNKIENLTRNTSRRVDVTVGVSYTADVDATRAAIQAAILRIPERLEERAPAVILKSLGDSAVEWEVQVWSAPSAAGRVRHETIRAIKQALDEAGISIPFPQRDVQLGGRVEVSLSQPGDRP